MYRDSTKKVGSSLYVPKYRFYGNLKHELENTLNAVRIPLEEGSTPRVIPETVEDFARLFAEASKAGLKLALRGMSTQGIVPAGRLEVCTLKLNIVEEGSEGDLTLEIGAGAAFDELERLTKEVSIEWSEYSGTIGGCLCGRRDIKAHIQLASRVMGMTFIRPTGEIIELGSKSVKDVVGYNLTPLLFGSQGRIGLAAKVIINTAPIFRKYFVPSANVENNRDLTNSGKNIVERLISTLDPGGIFS